MHLTTDNVCAIATAVSFLVPVIVHLFGATESAAGKFLLAICNDIPSAVKAAKRPPPGPDSEQMKPPPANPSQPSSSLLVGLATGLAFVTIFFAGCAATNTAAKDPLKAADDLFAMVCGTDMPIATCVHGFEQIAKLWTDRMAAKMAPVDAGTADSASK